MMKGNRRSYPIFLLVILLASSCTTKESSDFQGPLFTQLPASETGITFNNIVTDEKEHNILMYANYYGGGGVGVGDFNKDGLSDLYFAGNLVDDKLYLNKGDFRFEDISTSARLQNDGSWSSGVIVADVNNDGWEDIYVTCELYDDKPLLRANKLYINNGDLTFTNQAEKWGVADTARSRHAAFLDYNNDGLLDLFVLNQPPNPGSYSKFKDADLSRPIYSSRLYRNEGSKFKDITVAAGLLKSGYPNSVSASDFDNDGYIDLYIANDFEAPDFYYHNNGDGTFTDILQESMKHTSFYSMGVDAADINDDGLLDIMVLDMVAEDNYRLKANMGGMDPEAFFEVVKNGGHYQYMFNTFQLNQGRNIYNDIAQLSGIAATDWSWSNLFADLDNDGKKDLYVTNGLVRDIRNTDSQKKFSKYVVEKTTDFIKKYPNKSDITLFDVIDIKEAVKLIPSQKLTNYVFKNAGDFSFEKSMEDWGLNQLSFSNGSAYADLNNDGYLDLIVNNIQDEAFIFKNNGIESNHFLRIKLTDPDNFPLFGSKLTLEVAGNNQFIETTNVRGMYSTSEQTVHFGLGEHKSADKLTIRWPDGTISILNNIDADQEIEIVKKTTASAPKSTLDRPLFIKMNDHRIDFKHTENFFDDYRFQVLLPHELSHFGPALASADVNEDGLTDVYLGGASGQRGTLFLQQEDGTFIPSPQQPWLHHTLKEDVAAIFFDADNDGDPDLYVGHGGNEFEPGSPFYADDLYLNDGKGNFQTTNDALPALMISTGTVLPFDYDMDGDLDLFVGERFIPRDYPSPASGFLLENTKGNFKENTSQIAPDMSKIGLVTDAIDTDINQDGRPDIIVVGEWMSPRVFTNTQEGFIDQTDFYGISNKTGWWYSIDKGDFDNDGDDDFVLGNLGLNYKYKASEEEPFEVFYNDFDENGSKDIVLSYYNFGTQYPVRGRSCSVQQVPELSQKFASYELFAASDLDEIYEPAKLEGGLHLSAKTFSSIFIKNEGNGKLTPFPLPREAQFSLIHDTHIEDLNEDGHPDILYGGNLYVSEVETPRADAGIGGLLLGDGSGSFSYLSPHESGVYIPKDIRGITRISGSEKVRFLFAINDDYPAILERSSR